MLGTITDDQISAPRSVVCTVGPLKWIHGDLRRECSNYLALNLTSRKDTNSDIMAKHGVDIDRICHEWK